MATRKYGDKRVIDLSDWGRPLARLTAKFSVGNFRRTTMLILNGLTLIAFVLLVVKGVIDAVDGELARIRSKPSHVGRYWDTIADSIGLILVTSSLGISLESKV